MKNEGEGVPADSVVSGEPPEHSGATTAQPTTASPGNRRRIGVARALWGGAIAVACTAAMIAITVPLQASAGDKGAGSVSAAPSSSAAAQQGAPPPGKVEQLPPAGKKGVGRDPLTPDEITRARAIAVDEEFGAEAKDVLGKAGPEYLRTELAESAPGSTGPRLADVYFYDYVDGATVKRVVDLEADKVVKTASAKDIQPPPSARESEEALKLILADPLGERLKKNYRDATGDSLTDPDQLESTGMVHSPVGSVGTAVLDRCATHRCVSLFARVGGGGPWIDITDVVVDLTDRSVTRIH